MSFGKFLGDSSNDKKAPEPTTPAGFTIATRTAVETTLGYGSKIVGRLDFKEPAEIHGEIEGDITSQTRLVTGEQSKIRGTIDGAEVVIQGTMEGEVRASKRLLLKRPCKFKGNIYAANLSIEEGVIFEGGCSMPKDATLDSRSTIALKPTQNSQKPQIQSGGRPTTGVAA